MLPHSRWPGLVLSLCAAAAMAQDWTPNRWHHVTDGSPFFVDDRAALPTVAIQQDDGRFAQMVLGAPGEGALVSVNLPVSDISSELTSTLVMPEGDIFVRNVQGDRLVATNTPDGTSVTYSFGIAPDDVDRFMAAQDWRVQAGDALITISLVGSHDAISAAIAARDAASGDATRRP